MGGQTPRRCRAAEEEHSGQCRCSMTASWHARTRFGDMALLGTFQSLFFLLVPRSAEQSPRKLGLGLLNSFQQVALVRYDFKPLQAAVPSPFTGWDTTEPWA